MAFRFQFSVEPRYTPSIRFANDDETLYKKYPSEKEIYKLDPRDVPSECVVISNHINIPEFVPIGGWLGVSPEVRKLIDELEPGVHQFFPIIIRPKNPTKTLFHLDKRPITNPFNLLNIIQAIDAVCIERSSVDLQMIDGHQYVYPRLVFEIVLRRSLVAGHHVWRGRYHYPLTNFFSDTLGNQIVVRKWKGLRLTPVQEV